MYYELREISKRYDIQDLIKSDGSRKVTLCPFPFHLHSSFTPSFSIFYDAEGRQKFKCHGCGRGGDAVDLVGFLTIGPDYNPNSKEHILFAIDKLLTGFTPMDPGKVRKIAPRMKLPPDAWRMFPLGKEVIQYAAMRGLKEETLRGFGCGQADYHAICDAWAMMKRDTDMHWAEGRVWLTMPAFHYGTLMGIKLRNIAAKSKKDRYLAVPGSDHGIFNFNAIYSTGEPTLIVKGEISVMNLYQRGFDHVCATTCGESSVVPEWKVFFAFSRHKVHIRDNDPEEIAKKNIDKPAALRNGIFGSDEKFPPEQYHDVDDWILGDESQALDVIHRWLQEESYV